MMSRIDQAMVVDQAIVVEPNTIFREGFIRILSDTLGVKCVGFSSMDSMLNAATAAWGRSLFLLDCGSDLEALAAGIGQLNKRFPNSFEVVLSGHYSDQGILCSFKAGASGYILKQTKCEAILKSLQLVCLGEHTYPVQVVESLNIAGPQQNRVEQVSNPPLDILSPRELEVLEVLCEGHSNKVIARRCGITEATVKVHVKAILRKLKAKNRTEAAIWAHENKSIINKHCNRACSHDDGGHDDVGKVFLRNGHVLLASALSSPIWSSLLGVFHGEWLISSLC
jgi:two-component system, NarL family, nitrate/nitrite response regulator NarL